MPAGALARPPADRSAGSPDVIVDFVFDAGCFFVTVENLGGQPALEVTVAFDPAFRGLGGGIQVASLRMFGGIPFLAPRRRLMALVDTAAAYFARGEPQVITASVTWKDSAGEVWTRTCPHDLGIYADLPVLHRD